MAEPERPAPFLARRSYRQRRLVDAARILPVVGTFLVMVPLLWRRGGPESGGAALAEHATYLFVIWGILVLAAAALAVALRPADLNRPKDADGDADSSAAP